MGEILKKPVVNIPGCPPNPYNFLSTVVSYITYGKLPPLDSKGRPKFAYGNLIHENCERRPHFDAGRFAEQFGDAGHRSGWCLYKLGCKGPETYANCPTIRFGDTGNGSWPVSTGHPCIGCTEQTLAFRAPVSMVVQIHSPANPPSTYPQINSPQGWISPLATGLVGAAAGALVGVSYVVSRALPNVKTRGEESKAPDAAVASPAAETPDEGKQEPS